MSPEQLAAETQEASEWSDRDILTALMCAGADLDEPRHVLHYTYFLTESAAYLAAADMSAAGWYVEVAGPEGGEDDWLVLGQHLSVVLTQENVHDARGFFEEIAQKYVGDYEGWEASV